MHSKVKDLMSEHSTVDPIDKHIAVIGVGNMGSALLKGILNAKLTPAKKIIACDVDSAKLQKLNTNLKIHTTLDLKEACKESEIILLCVKPQMVSKVLDGIKQSLKQNHLMISIVAGVRISAMQKILETRIGIVRSMPNIPVTVSEGATALAFGEFITDEQKKMARSIFEAVGDVVVVAEDQLDAVTGLSGSGPAYICMIIEALIDGGVKMGLTRDVATKLAIQTVLGSAKLAKVSGLHPAILRDQVTTPGGTTINAIHELESHGLRAILIDAVTAATRRSEELSKTISNINQ